MEPDNIIGYNYPYFIHFMEVDDSYSFEIKLKYFASLMKLQGVVIW